MRNVVRCAFVLAGTAYVIVGALVGVPALVWLGVFYYACFLIPLF